MTTQTPEKQVPIKPRDKSRNLPPGYRVLHIQVPEQIFNRAKAGALLRGIDWPQFVIKLLEEASSQNGQYCATQSPPAPSPR